MDSIAHLALATTAFLMTHCIASMPLRGALVASLGELPYLGAYSLVSFLTLGWMIYAYLHAPFMPLWQIPGFKLGPLFVMPFALILLAGGVMSRNPTAVRQESALKSEEPVRGILRVTRHPVMWSFALWAAAHLLARGDTASLIFFGGFLALALGGTVLIDARKAHTLGLGLGGDWRRFSAVTSNIPFRAIIGGRNRFSLAEIGWTKILAGLVLYAVLFALHPHLFGARPY
jgi:uncharacterized membrane protein